MLDVNKVVLVGEICNIHQRDDALNPTIFFQVRTCMHSLDGRSHPNTHNVVAFGKNAGRLMHEIYDGLRIYIDGRLESKIGKDDLSLVQVVVISFSLDIYEFEQSGIDRSFDEGPRSEGVTIGD